MKKEQKQLMAFYDYMLAYFGPRHWWPAETPFEVVIGAILTQSVSWKNVEKAIENLKAAGIMDCKTLVTAPDQFVEEAVRPTRYYRQKAARLKGFCKVLTEEFDGELDNMWRLALPELRQRLLHIKGIGQETADSIILYAAEKPIFVVDAYTRRIFSRLGIFDENIDYERMQRYFMTHLPADVQLFNEYHALIVGTGNRFCGNTRPLCDECPLHPVCKA